MTVILNLIVIMKTFLSKIIIFANNFYMQKNYSFLHSTKNNNYTKYLYDNQYIWWKKIFDVQRPYRWNLRRIKPGFVLDIGCGIGRNLLHLKGNGVGIDHNPTSVEIAKTQGLQVFTNEEFEKSEYNTEKRFDSILLSHVAEHLTEYEVISLLKTYLPLLKNSGKVILITPQEKGYSSDNTHVQFMNFETLNVIANNTGLLLIKEYSFPFPRFAGRFFKYNEFICICEKQ